MPNIRFRNHQLSVIANTNGRHKPRPLTKTSLVKLYKKVNFLNSSVFSIFGNTMRIQQFENIPQVWSLVEGPKSTYMFNLSLSHIAISLFPKNIYTYVYIIY